MHFGVHTRYYAAKMKPSVTSDATAMEGDSRKPLISTAILQLWQTGIGKVR